MYMPVRVPVLVPGTRYQDQVLGVLYQPLPYVTTTYMPVYTECTLGNEGMVRTAVITTYLVPGTSAGNLTAA